MYLSLSALRAGWLPEFVWATCTGWRLARCMILQAQCQCLTREYVVPARGVSESLASFWQLTDCHAGVRQNPVGSGDEPQA